VKMLLCAVAKIMHSSEEIQINESVFQIASATQVVVNSSTQLLRCVYSGTDENLESLISTFFDQSTSLAELIADKLLGLSIEIRSDAKREAQNILQAGHEIISQAEKFLDVHKDEDTQLWKINLQSQTKNLVKAFRNLSILLEKPLEYLHTSSPLQLYIHSHKQLSDSIAHYEEENLDASLVSKIKEISTLIKSLIDGNDPLTISTPFMTLISDMESVMLNESHKVQSTVIELIDPEELELHALHFNEIQSYLKNYVSFFKIKSNALRVGLDLDAKSPDKLNIVESISQSVTSLLWTIDAFSNYRSSLNQIHMQFITSTL